MQRKLLPEKMSLENAFKVAQAMELVAIDVAHIKNRDIDNIHKMSKTKQSRGNIKAKDRMFWVLKRMA